MLDVFEEGFDVFELLHLHLEYLVLQMPFELAQTRTQYVVIFEFMLDDLVEVT